MIERIRIYDLDKVRQLVLKLKDEYPAEVVKALNETAKDAKTDEVQGMRSAFDRPTPYTLNALFIRTANLTVKRSSIYFKDETSVLTSKGTPAWKFLEPEILGGGRVVKRFEEHLRRVNAMAPNQYAVPCRGAPRDAYGNVTSGLIIQMLSSLGGLRDPRQWQTQKSVARKNAAEFFVMVDERNRRTGIWRKQGNKITPIFRFVAQRPTYSARFDFYGIGSRSAAQNFDRNFGAALDETLKNSA